MGGTDCFRVTGMVKDLTSEPIIGAKKFKQLEAGMNWLPIWMVILSWMYQPKVAWRFLYRISDTNDSVAGKAVWYYPQKKMQKVLDEGK